MIASAPRLQLYDPATPTTRFDHLRIPHDAKLTVREYYDQRMADERESLDHRTRGTDREALSAWETYGESIEKDWFRDDFDRMTWQPHGDGRRVKDPAIGLIVDEDLSRFLSLQQQRGLSPTTINKQLRHLMAIFTHAGPRDAKNRKGNGIILRCPYAKPLPTVVSQNFIPSPDEVTAFFKAAERATWPKFKGGTPPEYWQALIVFLCNYGLRPRDWRSLLWYENLVDDCQTLKYVAHKTRRKRPYPVVFSMNATARPFLMRLLHADRVKKNRRLFFSAQSRNYFEPQWKALVQAAGVSRLSEPDALGRRKELFEPYCLRRFCNDWFNTHCEGRPGEWLLNHAFKDQHRINSQHYSWVYRAPPEVEDALLTAPQLECFTAAMPAKD